MDDLDVVFRGMMAVRGQKWGLDDADLVPRFRFLSQLAQRVQSTNTIDCEDIQKTFEQVISRIRRKREAAWIPDHYLITSRGERGALRYGLDVDPESIVWEAAESQNT